MNDPYRQLLALEKDFFRLERISDRNWLDSVLDSAFEECGKSGRLFGREETIRALLRCTADRPIALYSFTCAPVGAGCWLVHYLTREDGRLYYRTSLWVGEDHPRLRFHRATPFTG